MHRWTRITSVALGLALVVGAPLVWQATRPPAEIGEVPGADTPVPDTPPVTVLAEGQPRPPAEPEAAEPEPVEPQPGVAEPVGIRIAAIDVDAPVLPVGLEPDGTMEIPDDVREVGWYAPGVAPGENGSAVLAGHVDSRLQGQGAFFGLRDLDLDDTVVLDHADGTESTWRVVARQRYPKDELPIDELFVWGGDDQQLALITCGGPFDRATGHYTENVVVYAVPV